MDDSFAVQTALTGSEASYADKSDQSYVQVCYFLFATFFVFSRLVESFEFKLGHSQLLVQFLAPGATEHTTHTTHSTPVQVNKELYDAAVRAHHTHHTQHTCPGE
jgi:hypothetical protein